MSNNFKNPETNFSTLKIETPEELKWKLEDKIDKTEDKANKNYIERIDKISSQVTLSTEEKWEKLKNELDKNEEQEIISIINTPEAKLENRLNEGLTGEQKKIVQASDTLKGTLLEDKEKEIVKGLGYIEKLEKSWTKAGELFSEGKYLAAFMALIGGLFGKWNPESNKNEDKEGKKEVIDTKEIKNTNNKFLTTASVFTSLSIEGSNKNINDIIVDKNFSKLKYNEVIELSKLENKDLKAEIEKKGITKAYDMGEIKIALDMIIKGKGNNIIKEIYKDDNISNKTIDEIITGLSDELILLKDINSKNIDSAKEILNGLDIKINSKGELEGNLERKLKSVSKNIIILTLTGDYKFDKKENVKEKIENSSKYEDFNTKEKEQLNKIIDFGFNIQETIKTTESLNLGNIDLKNQLNQNPLNINEIIKLYAITGGESDFEKLNGFQKTYLYFSISNILDKRGQNEEEGSYKMAITKSIIEKGENTKIPDDVKNILNSIGNSIKENTSNTIKEFSDEVKGAIKEDPSLAIAAMILLLIWPFKKTESILEKMTK